jgi:cytochrome P450
MFTELVLAGIPHLVMQDDIYKGMRIPRGSIVFANALYVPSLLIPTRHCHAYRVNRSMSLDDKVHADPTKFYPERFLPTSAGGNDEPYPIASFGFGRR